MTTARLRDRGGLSSKTAPFLERLPAFVVDAGRGPGRLLG